MAMNRCANISPMFAKLQCTVQCSLKAGAGVKIEKRGCRIDKHEAIVS